MTLTLRRKLFAAFFLAMLGPVLILGALAAVYAGQLRKERLARFAYEAQAAFGRRSADFDLKLERFGDRLAGFREELEACADTSCHEKVWEEFRVNLPGVPGVESLLVRAEADPSTVYFSKLAPDQAMPGPIAPIIVTVARDNEDLFVINPEDLPKAGGPLASGRAQTPSRDGWIDTLLPLKDRALVREMRRSLAEPVLRVVDEGGHSPAWFILRLRGGKVALASPDLAPLHSEESLFGLVTGFVGEGVAPSLSMAEFSALTLLPSRGEVGVVRGASGIDYAVARATSSENASYSTLGRQTDLIGVVPLASLYGSINRALWAAAGAIVGFAALGLLAAGVFSRRMLAAIGRVRSSLSAIGSGATVELGRVSKDELGGQLIDDVNALAKEMAERSRREEMASWRRAIRVISHEINNTIAPLRSVSATLREELGDAARSTAYLQRAATLMTDRIEALDRFVKRFGELAKLPPPSLEACDLARVVENAVRMFTEEAAQRGVTLQVEAQPVSIAVDPGQIERVVINLVKNALEASPPGEVVVVRVRADGGHAFIEVEDRGAGISDDARPNLFVPAFSTKPNGSGTGLALAQQIVLGHRGWITAINNSQVRATTPGALFRVKLPLQAQA